jgi:hypothetical protein
VSREREPAITGIVGASGCAPIRCYASFSTVQPLGQRAVTLPARLSVNVIDWYVATDEAGTAERLIAQLRRAHLSLSRRFPRDSASYMLAHIADTGTALVLHGGDCLLGSHEGNGPVHWFTRPHTLANATGDMPIDEIARNPVRNRLTRSFRAREFIHAEVNEIK